MFFFNNFLFAQSIFKDIIIQADTNSYFHSKNSIQYVNEKFFFFKVHSPNEICELTIYPLEHKNISYIQLLSSSDFEILDTLALINGEYFRGKLQFKNLQNAKFSRFVFRAHDSISKSYTEEVRLYPYFETSIYPIVEPIELYEGEEKVVEINGNNLSNIRIEERPYTARNLEYKLTKENDKVFIHIHPKSPGTENLTINLKSIKPNLDDFNHLTYDVNPLNIKFTILPSRINYLNFDKNEFFFDPQFNAQSEVQIENNKTIAIHRTYRIENQQEPGGKLIAELFTKSDVSNSGKILCVLRPYALHKLSEGYLYIKDDDITKFITNLNIIQKPSVDKVSVLRDGENWTENLTVYPGENIEVRIEGSSLGKADFLFDLGLENIHADTSRHSDNVAYYLIKVPENFSKKRINILMNKQTTRYELLVREYQLPRELDFVNISYDNTKSPVTNDKFNKPILRRETIEDINFIFDPKKIDTKNKFYGKQYLSIEVKIFNPNKDLIEIQKIENIVICPGENSPRYSFYDVKDCKNITINLNEYLLHKTFDLDAWSHIELTIRHMESKYTTQGFAKKIVIIKEKLVLLDMQVSFPAGLLVKNFDTPGIGRFTGISTAFLAQLSFYDRQKIGKVKPYKVGAGLIALDVFNVNSTQRDLGMVVLGSLLPVRNSRFSFPIYGGFGYLIQSKRMFFVFGPGIQFNF